MKITKYIHSCLLVEENKQFFLFDPGRYTYNARALDINKLDKLDYILITHSHGDHCHLPFIRQLYAKFPQAQIITNSSVKKKLEDVNILAKTSLNQIIRFEPSPHERVWDSEPPENVAITILDKLTHPGDSLRFKRTGEILALPLTAPWGSTMDCITKALQMRPKIIIPIHDYLWRDEIRITMYKRLLAFFANKGITFISLETGELREL